MTLDEIYNAFSRNVANINVYQRAAKNTATKELRALNDYLDQVKDSPERMKESSALHAMYYRNPETGDLIRYGFSELSVHERTNLVILQKNKQYCWLLIEIYEEFEDFLEAAYAFLGCRDNSKWLMTDYGNIPMSDVAGKKFEWYLERAKAKKDAPRSILNRFREIYSRLSNVETNNTLNVNLRVAIELIGHLRHVIVHNSGTVSSREDFLKNVLKKAGVWNNGKYHPGYEEFVGKFFGDGEYSKLVALLEVPIEPDLPIAIHHDRFGELSGYLVAYAAEIYKCMEDMDDVSHNK